MNRSRIASIHAASSTIGLLIIIIFFVSTAVAEIGGEVSSIQLVKQYILYGLIMLVPSMALSGITGNQLAGKSQAPIIQQKKKRMKVVMVLGLGVLIPCAVALHLLAQEGSFTTLFYGIQFIEFIAGGTNIYLMGHNMKVGLQLSGRISKKLRAKS